MQSFLQKHRWVILFAGASIQILTGIPAAWGVFRASVATQYKFSTDTSVMIFSLTIAFFGIGCIIGGFLQDKKGPRIAGILGAVMLSSGFCVAAILPMEKPVLFYVLYSAPVGLGCAFLYPAVMSTAQKWYAHKKGLATGIVGGAVGASGAVLTLLGRGLIDLNGIRFAFMFLGILMLIVCLSGAIILVNPISADTKAPPCSQKNYTVKQMFCTPQYYAMFAIACLATPSVLLFSPVIVELGKQRGLSEEWALATIVIGSVFSAAGRLLMPWLSDKIGRRYADMLIFVALIAFSVWFIFAQSYLVILVYGLLTFCYSGEAAILPCAVSDLYGKKNSGVCYGFVALGMSVGSVGFPLLARVIASGIAPHIIAAVSAALGLCITFFLKPTQGKKL